MKLRKIALLFVLASVLGAAATTVGCRHSGSREFIPGRGWVPN
jgi:hypothetical protein